jgi:2-polyprenyl-6-hydroxyphenyl methylase/3-demethylubiquinone-9 3-methyltransferase
MAQSLEIYGQLDWWNPGHSLLQMVGFKLDYFRAQIGPLAGTRVLDLGCGGGLLAEALAKEGAAVTGIDLSERALQTARDHAAAGGLRIRYQRGRAEALPCADASFDAVVCGDCLEHVDDLDRVIGEVARVLRDGGVFCYDTFNRNFLSRVIVGWLVEWHLRREYRRLNVTAGSGAVHDWRKFIKPAELTALMARHGLGGGELRGVRPRPGGLQVGGRPWVMYIGSATRRPRGDGRIARARPE